LRSQLIAEKLWEEGALKPTQMKKARDRAASIGKRTTGSPIFRAVFTHLSSRALDECVEPGFRLMREKLTSWFPKVKEAWEQ
jgi:hypothetical protein